MFFVAEYLESLCASSLIEDVHRFDFNQASLAAGTYDPFAARSVDTQGTTVSGDDASVVRLPLDQLDQHRCMASLVHLLKQFPVKPTGDGPPDWMNSLRKILTNAETHRNVYSFLLLL